MFKLIVLSALLAVCLSAPTPLPLVDSDEIAVLSQSQPCRGRIAGTRLRHPTDDHKYLRCVGPESFWIETCPDNLFFNQELDLCDWTPISETTTVVNDIVKFRPVLFRNNKTVEQVEVVRPVEFVDKSKLPVRVISSRVRDDTDVAEIRQVPVVVESEEEQQVDEPETVTPMRRVPGVVVVTTTPRSVQVVRPVVVDVDEEPVRVSKVVETPIKPSVVVEEEEDREIAKPVRVTPVPAIVSRPVSPVVEVVKTVVPPVTARSPIADLEEVDVVKPVSVVRRPVVTTTVEEVDVVKRPATVVPSGVTVQKPVTVVEEVDFTPKPVKFIARPGVGGTRAFGALSHLTNTRVSIPFPSASVIRTDFVSKLSPMTATATN